MVTEIMANAWTLQSGDKIVRGLFADCTVEYVADTDEKGQSRVYYRRYSDRVFSFTTNHNRPFTIIPANV